MLDENLARMRAHRNNIHRYRRLLNTKLTDTEKAFITRRLDEEQRALEQISGSTFPLSLKMPSSSSQGIGHV